MEVVEVCSAVYSNPWVKTTWVGGGEWTVGRRTNIANWENTERRGGWMEKRERYKREGRAEELVM